MSRISNIVIFSSTNDLPNTTNFTNIDEKCSLFYANTTGILIKDYDGIPENLIVNLIAWLVLVVLFTFLRHIGDYGRLGLLKSDEERNRNRRYSNNLADRWTAKFFGKSTHGDIQLSSSSENEATKNDKPIDDTLPKVEPNQLTSTPGEQSVSSSNESASSSTNFQLDNKSLSRSLSLLGQDFPHAQEYQEKHVLSWLVNLIKLKDKHINEKCGRDAHNYLVFQRYLIVFIAVVTLLSVAVLLPINLTGNALINNKIFGATTIMNLLPNSPVIWVHLSFSWLFLVLGLIFMRQFSKKMEYTESDYISRTVLITGFPSNYCKKEYIEKHFEEAFPDLKLTDIQFAYDVNKLNKLDVERRSMEIGRKTSEKLYEQTGKRPMMYPFHFGSFVELCCCCCKRCFKNTKNVTDAINFYSSREQDLSLKISLLREKTMTMPLGIVFVTFEEQLMADKFLQNYHLGYIGYFARRLCTGCCKTCFSGDGLLHSSSLRKQLKANKWHAAYSPSPTNIKWENISKISALWWLRAILINLVLVILMIFFTTPAILIEKFSEHSGFLNTTVVQKYFPSYVSELLPSLLLRLLAALLPVLVAYTALAELHWTRSAENHSMMIKTFTLLLFMVLILPTLGLTSINAVFQWINKKDDQDVIKWRCVSDNGAFFLKYITTCSLIGTALDLLRLPDLLLYVIKTLWSRSSAERLAVRMKVAFDFDYGVQYAWILTVFTVVLCFSVVCPLITPVGLLYLVLKHLVDRYNLYFAYVSTKVDKSIHKTAVTFCISSFLLLQLCIFFFIAVRNKGVNASNQLQMVQGMVLVVTFIIFFGRIFFGFFKKLSPFNEKNSYDFENGNSTTDLNNNSTELINGTPTILGISSTKERTANATINISTSEAVPSTSTQIPSAVDDSKQIHKRKCKELLKTYESPFIPGILKPSKAELSNKLNKLKRSSKKLNSSTNENEESNAEPDQSIVDQSHVKIDLDPHEQDDTDSTSKLQSYGAINMSFNESNKEDKAQKLDIEEGLNQTHVNQSFVEEAEN